MGLAIVLAPPTNDRFDLVDQLLRAHRRIAPCALANLFLEVPDRIRTPNRIARSPEPTTPDLRVMQSERPLALFDRVAEKLKPVFHMDNSGLLGIQGHAQLGQYPFGFLQSRTGFALRATCDQPVSAYRFSGLTAFNARAPELSENGIPGSMENEYVVGCPLTPLNRFGWISKRRRRQRNRPDMLLRSEPPQRQQKRIAVPSVFQGHLPKRSARRARALLLQPK